MVRRRIFDHCGEHPAVAGEQRMTRGDVSLPWNLLRVCHVEPLRWLKRVQENDVRTRIAGRVVEAQPGPSGEDPMSVSTGGDYLGPGQLLSTDAVRNVW
ncbi:hypothetical protein GCM10023171_35710 [Microbacterium panaciterrae]|uniref:Uncharacterized protein n=1 Tax=Microbacterium panaciterrae TaxID=985759 RepID=A0ABP8PQS4_9MICO